MKVGLQKVKCFYFSVMNNIVSNLALYVHTRVKDAANKKSTYLNHDFYVSHVQWRKRNAGLHIPHFADSQIFCASLWNNSDDQLL